MQATLQLAEMARLGVQPDSIAATALVNACARNNRMDMALSVFDELFGELPLYFSSCFKYCPVSAVLCETRLDSSVAGILHLLCFCKHTQFS